MVQTLRSRGSHPSLSDSMGSRRPERRANLPYPEAAHATIEAYSIAAVAIMNQKSRWRSIPGAAFHDLLCDPASRRMPRHFNVEDLSVCGSDDEEDVKRLETVGTQKKSQAQMSDECRVRNSRHVPVGSRLRHTRIYWPRSWRKPETLTLPIRPGCAFEPKGDSRLPYVRSELEALPGSPGDHLSLDEKIATSSTPSNRLAASPKSGRTMARTGLRMMPTAE